MTVLLIDFLLGANTYIGSIGSSYVILVPGPFSP